MKNQDFTSAVELFDKEEFDNITGEAEENIMGDRLEEFLKEFIMILKYFLQSLLLEILEK